MDWSAKYLLSQIFRMWESVISSQMLATPVFGWYAFGTRSRCSRCPVYLIFHWICLLHVGNLHETRYSRSTVPSPSDMMATYSKRMTYTHLTQSSPLKSGAFIPQAKPPDPTLSQTTHHPPPIYSLLSTILTINQTSPPPLTSSKHQTNESNSSTSNQQLTVRIFIPPLFSLSLSITHLVHLSLSLHQPDITASDEAYFRKGLSEVRNLLFVFFLSFLSFLF